MSDSEWGLSPQPAYAINGHSVSADAFYAVACHPHRPVTVEACAGAGKTWMLVSRMVRALLSGAEPQQILAITFTKKAAAEMGERLHQWLRDFSRSDDATLLQWLRAWGMSAHEAQAHVEPLRNLYLRLLQHDRSVQVRTFHGWFIALLGAAPLQVLPELGLPASYRLLESDEEAVAAVWPLFYAALLHPQHAAEQADFHALVQEYGRSNTHAALTEALHHRNEFMLADAADVAAESVPPAAEVFPEYAAYADARQAMFDSSHALHEQLWQAARALGSMSGATGPKLAAELEAGLTDGNSEAVMASLFGKEGKPRVISKKLADDSAIRQAQAALERMLAVQHQQRAHDYHQRMVRLVRLLCACYAQVKRDNGWVDMADVERAARHLLQNGQISGWIQQRLDAQIRHVLIDEFQDTNPMQWQALYAWLSGYGGAGSAPSLFVVGDPKQSIYRFRGAESRVFAQVQQFVREALGGDALQCNHTRRNSQAVIAAVNHMMLAAQQQGHYGGFVAHTTASEQVGSVQALPLLQHPARQQATADAGQVSTAPQQSTQQTYVAAQAAHGGISAITAHSEPAMQADSATALAWRDSLTTPRMQAQEALALRECRQAAAWLAQQLRQGMRPDSFLVLARKRDTLRYMQQALAEQGVPASIAQKQRMADAPEVQDVVALLDVLLSPTHDISLAQVLKSPLFGLDDAQLAAMALAVQQRRDAQQPLNWLDWLLEQAQQPADVSAQPWQTLGQTLKLWQQWVQQMLPHDALVRIYQHGDVLARYASTTPAAQRTAVLERLRALPASTLHMHAGRFISSYEWVRAMRQSTGGQEQEVGAAPDSVALLTVHAAKGLEADTVLLLNTWTASERADTMQVLMQWPASMPHPQVFAFVTHTGQPPPALEQVQQEERAMDAREEYNMLYVALTRARRQIVFSAREPYRQHSQSWWLQAQSVPQLQTVAIAQSAADDACTADADEHKSALGQDMVHIPALPPLAADWQGARQAEQGGQGEQVASVPQDLQHQAVLGQAMHRVLEWHSQQQTESPMGDTALLQSALHQQFGLTAEDAHIAIARADAVLQGEAGWIWGTHVDWAANEVDVAVPAHLPVRDTAAAQVASSTSEAVAMEDAAGAGDGIDRHKAFPPRIWRLDRLIHISADDAQRHGWWVVDYKSASTPEQQPALLRQLRRYCQAVRWLYPGEPVRAVFVTAQGRCVYMPDDVT